jgi:hypothetical protein
LIVTLDNGFEERDILNKYSEIENIFPFGSEFKGAVYGVNCS